MSKIKDHYHEEICNGLIDSLDLDYLQEKYKNEQTCEGDTTSNCCGASFVPETNFCCDCSDYASTSCVDCVTPCVNFKELVTD